MFSILKTRFGIPGVISVIALVLATTGGAFAAKYLITSTNQIKPSVLKKLKGTRGPTGPTGAQGSAGANGKDGAPGAEGKQGSQGIQGENGSPWTAGGVLPPGETETGTFVTHGATPGGTGAISFPIPLASPVSATNIVVIQEAASVPANCNDGEGTAPGVTNPEADAGKLCIFAAFGGPVGGVLNPTTFEPEATVVGGMVVQTLSSLDETGFGSWAVTAP